MIPDSGPIAFVKTVLVSGVTVGVNVLVKVGVGGTGVNVAVGGTGV